MPAKPLKSLFGGRDVALTALLDAWTGRAFAAETIAQRCRGGVMNEREAALATHLALTALRHTYTLDHVLGAVAKYDRRRVTPWARGVLHLAATQIVYLDRIPAFAAVDQAVEQARAVAGGPAGGMCNAVLRRLTAALIEPRTRWAANDPTRVRVRFADAGRFDQAVLPLPALDAAAHILAATGFPRLLWKSLLERHTPDEATAAAWASQGEPALVVHRNSQRISQDDFAARVAAFVVSDAPSVGDRAFLPSAALAALADLLNEGLAYVQDTTAHEVVAIVAPQPGEKILDLCAAPGGKSVALALASDDQSEIHACDVSPARLKRLNENVQRLRLRSVQVHQLPPDGSVPPDFHGEYDAVLLDVPCSNSGVLARRPEARFRLDDHHAAELNKLQQSILARAATCVRPGGRLIYSTCSILPRENQAQVEAFLLERSTWVQEDTRTTLPAWGAERSDWRDGGYVTRLRHG